MPIRNDESLFNVYTYRVDNTSIKIIPIVTRLGTDWTIRIFLKQAQGPVWEGTELTAELLDSLDLADVPAEKVQEINECVEWANEYLVYDSEFNRKQRGQEPISTLAGQTSKGKLIEKLSEYI